MRVLYAAFRHDPRDPDASSGTDFNYHSALLREGAEVKLVGPFSGPGALPERLFRRVYRAVTGKNYAKFLLSNVLAASRALNHAERTLKPDLVFSVFPCSLVFYNGAAPCVYRLDTSFIGWQEGYPTFGRLGLRLGVWQERRALNRCAKVLTMSDWSKRILTDRYGVPSPAIAVMPNPSALPSAAVPRAIDFLPKRIEMPVRLLLVGRDYRRKGIPIAIEVARRLNEKGVPTDLTICGLAGEPDGPVRFAGLFRKSVPEELRAYADLYRQAHLLIHPALFEAAGIVPAEAAAFGVPTITNDVGGLATAVAHGVSGVVLPGHSPAEAYVEAITKLVRCPGEYTRLSVGARKRYEEEQNWEVAGRRVMKILEEVAALPRG